MFDLGLVDVRADRSPGGLVVWAIVFRCGCETRRWLDGLEGPTWRCPAHQPTPRGVGCAHDWQMQDERRTYVLLACQRCGIERTEGGWD
jgi:hypothetical protein